MSNNPCHLNQVSNRNFLSIGGFQLVLNRCRKVDFLCNKANLPGLSMGSAIQSNYLRDIPVPGDKIQYEDLRVDFIVDENMENYHQIYNWMRELGYPEDLGQSKLDNRSDATLLILNSSLQVSGKVKFRDVFPVSLEGIPFNATIQDQQYFTATAVFKYTMFDLMNIDGKEV